MSSRIVLVLMLAVLCAASTTGAGYARAEEAARDGGAPRDRAANYGSWAITCPEGERCRLAQSVVGSAQMPLLVARAFKTPERVIVLSVPAGIYLAPGLALQIGDGKSRRYPFEMCDGAGCYTGVKIDDPLFKELSVGKDAKISFFDGAQKVVTVMLSLEGFQQGFDAL